MGLLPDDYGFADFSNRWAAELGRDPTDIARVLATAMHNRELEYDVHNPHDPGPSHNQQVPFQDDPQWQEFDAVVSDHLYRLEQGIDRPDLAERLRFVSFHRDKVASWLSSRGEEMPRFWRDDVAGGDASEATSRASVLPVGDRNYLNLQKAVAVLAAIVAERGGRFKRGDKINVSQIRNEIQGFLDAYPELSKKLGQGFARATLDQKIGEALGLLGEEEDRQ